MTNEDKLLLIEMNKAILTIYELLGRQSQAILQVNQEAGKHLVPQFNAFIERNKHLVDPKIQVVGSEALKRPS